LIKEKRRANIELGRECLLDERCYVGRYKGSMVKIKVGIVSPGAAG